MNIKNLENYVKNLGIPNVDFSELEISVASQLVEAIDDIYNKYPALKNTICSIGNNEYINNQCNLLENSNIYKKPKWSEFSYIPECFFCAIASNSKIPHIIGGKIFYLKNFIALTYSDYIEKKELTEFDEELKHGSGFGFRPKHCTTLKSCIYHELGHILDFTLNLSNDKKVYELIRSRSNNFLQLKDKVSLYAAKTNMLEVIAEIFAEYIICPDSNDLINAVGRYIDEKYKKYENTKLFMVNHKFKFDDTYLYSEKQMPHKK